MTVTILLLLATYFAHSTLFLASAWVVERAGWIRRPEARELLWRLALLAGVATASAQVLLPPFESVLGAPETSRTSAGSSAGVPIVEPAELRVPTSAEPASRPADSNADYLVGVAGTAQPAAILVPARMDWTLPAEARGLAIWIALLWTLVSLASALSLVRAVQRRVAALARLATCDDPATIACVERVCRANDLRTPRLVEDPDSNSPTANLGGVLTLPPWALRESGAQGLEAMLAHELGHIARHDIAWRVTGALVRALFWFQPLNAIATRRLESLAEFGADSWAVRATGDRRALAECLARCAEEISATRTPALAIAMVGKSQVLTRIQRILEEKNMKPNFRPIHWVLITIAALCAFAALPVVVIGTASAGRGTHIETGRGPLGINYSKVNVQENDLDLSAEIRGKIKFTAAEDDVMALGSGGEAWIVQKADGVKRRIEFENESGKLVRRYFVDGQARTLDAEGRTWLRNVIPTLLRESGLDAEARTKRIHARGGANAVLGEIALLRGEHVRRIYIANLAGLGQLEPAQLGRAIASAGAIDSDFERRESLNPLIESQAIAPEQQVQLLGVVAKMDSDFEKRSVLVVFAGKLADDPTVGAAWGRALESIDSSFERREALVALAERPTPATNLLRSAFAAITTMDSDFEKRTALKAFARHARGARFAPAYIAATRSIDSDFERREALLALLDRGPVNAITANAVIEAVATMGSDFEQREVLVRLAKVMPKDAMLIERYRAVARKMSDYERGQAEKSLDRFAG